MRLLQTFAAFVAAALMVSGFGGAAAAASSVGFQHFSIPDGAGPAIEVGVWYPSDAPASPQPLELFTQTVATNGAVVGRGLPLVVISHGTGGSYAGHYDTALALAKAGFVVAALTHTGDNWSDSRLAAVPANRPRQLHVLIDYMLKDWSGHGAIDPNRVGAFGFSAGGMTVLIAGGGNPDLGLFQSHCVDHPSFFDCRLVAAHPIKVEFANLWAYDARLKAIVAAAPALGFAFTRAGLRNVTEPVDLWRDEDDHILPNPFYAEAVRQNLPTPPSYHVVPHMDHFDFLAPCSPALAKTNPEICKSEAGFDRAAFHGDFNRQVVRFFTETLKR